MKKKFTLIIISILALTMSIMCFMPLGQTALADENVNPNIEFIRSNMEKLDTDLKNRNLVGITNPETKSAIIGMFNSEFYTITEQTSEVSTEDNIYKPYNLIIKKKDYSKDKQDILFCVNIDNFYDRKLETGANYLVDGSSAYGSSVGLTMAAIMAKKAENMTSHYNIVFVLLCGNDTVAYQTNYAQSNAFGTSKYISEAELGRVNLVVDISKPLGGEYNYIYTGETDKILYSETTKFMNTSFNVFAEQPKNKKAEAYGDSTSKFGIRHAGMTNISLPFMEKNIQTMTFLSMNWNDSYSVYEFKDKPNLYNSNLDTLENLLSRSPSLYTDMDVLSSSLLTMLENESIQKAIVSSMEISEYSPLNNYKTFKIISYVILGVAVLAMILLIFYFKKHNNTNTGRPTEFDKPSGTPPDIQEPKKDVFQGF